MKLFSILIAATAAVSMRAKIEAMTEGDGSEAEAADMATLIGELQAASQALEAEADRLNAVHAAEIEELTEQENQCRAAITTVEGNIALEQAKHDAEVADHLQDKADA